jgi:hypothetical protein
MVENDKEAVNAIAKELIKAVDELRKDPMQAYVLKDADENIKRLVRKKYSNIQDALFLMFFYSNFRYHLWAHIAADASLKMSDSETEGIVTAVRVGLEYLAKSLMRYDKAEIYTALVKLVSDYLNELNKEG